MKNQTHVPTKLVKSSLDTNDSRVTPAAAGNAFPNEFLHLLEGEIEVTYTVPISKMGTSKNPSLTPVSIMVVDTIGGLTSRQVLRVLFDPGSTRTLIYRGVLPKNVKPQN